VDNEDGIVLDHAVFIGKSTGRSTMLVPAIQRISPVVTMSPKAGDSRPARLWRGCRSATTLSNLGVRQVVLDQGQTRRRPSSRSKTRKAFQEAGRWRTGSEDGISCLNANFGWNRDAHRWSRRSEDLGCGPRGVHHNLVKVAALVVAKMTLPNEKCPVRESRDPFRPNDLKA